MGCLKLPYRQEGDRKYSPLKICDGLEEKEDVRKKCDDYYPFGLTFNSSERSGFTTNKFLYNGKELQMDLDLNWHDYGARMYEAAIGRWGTVDPLSENNISLSPYNYSVNNPIRYFDPDGNTPEDVVMKAQAYIGTYYEYGGKNPYYVGASSNVIDRTRAYFVSQMMKFSISQGRKWRSFAGANNYPRNTYRYVYHWIAADDIYSGNQVYVPKNFSMGIDCSGLAKLAFNNDPDKWMGDLGDGADNQMRQFEKAEGKGTGHLHSNFDQLEKGDLIFRTENGEAYHVLVATGKAYINGDGELVAKVIHAPNHGKKVLETEVKIDSNMKIGHTFRGEKDSYYEDQLYNTNNYNYSWSQFRSWVLRNGLENKITWK